jgi:cytochrome c553
MPLAQHSIRSILFAFTCSIFVSQAMADDAASAPSFADAVGPLLKEHCFACHGADLAEGNLRLDTLAGINKGGNSGQPVVPGKPDESLLITAVRRTDELLKMPPDEKLSEDAVKLLTAWVQSGAAHPEGPIAERSDAPPFDVEEARKFWAFQEIRTPAIPAVADSELVSSPIDAFVISRLTENSLKPNPLADKATLIRRASFDLTGLPPSPQDIAEFLADESPDAFAKVIDRLLATQQYGERWGRHWLDVVRYADSNGLDENIAHGNAWRYRNYVINSFNADKPYDQFLREQIAGDLLINETTDEATRIERLTATGFYSLGPKVLAEGDETKLQMDILDEQIDTMGRSMLGLTLGCARCHDHKFDPIAQADYYALAGIFQSTKTMESLKRIAKWNENSIATVADNENLEQHKQKIEAKKQEISTVLAAETARVSAAGSPPVPEASLPEEAKQKLATLRDELKKLEASVPELPTAMGVLEGDVVNAKILIRGNHLSQGRMVPRGVPVVLAAHGFAAPEKQSGRLEFADWLTSPKNPLTARVIVNRVWRWHFGRGLVATADNFGKLGERPGNPDLLDWLASEFIRSGWSMKSLHKTIMLSRTWQLSNDDNPAAETVDPDNHLQWRWSTQRLEAEAVRDSILAVTGRLDRSMGQSMLHVKNREFLFDHTSKDGTSYDSKRRSVYLPVIRNNLYDAMSLFDCTDGTVPNGDRASSTVASQALFFMNSDLVIEAAEDFAGELLKENPDDAGARIQSLFTKVLGRSASEQDIEDFQKMSAMIDAQLVQDGVPDAERLRAVWTSLVQTVLMSNEFLYVR